MKKLLLSAVLCGVVAFSFSACSSDPEKLVEIVKKVKEAGKMYDECNDQECRNKAQEELKNLKLEGDEIWKILSEEEKDLFKELLEKEGIKNSF